MSTETRLRRGGQERRVTLVPDGDTFAASVDGSAHRVLCLAAGPRAAAAGATTVEELALEIDGRPCRVLVARRRDRVTVALDGRVYAFETGEDADAARPGAAGSATVTAPMPGKIVAVLVAVGEVVEHGQSLVVLEAMKMESTLAAEVAGTVTAVHATLGAMVDAGAVLVTIAPVDATA
jgi:acetyl/propionyl-CoA carboxylase alpha subunit